jgi:hypothetical protein
MNVIGLRPAVPSDSEFCYQLHKAAMGDYVTAVWGWDEQHQRDFHDGVFNPGRWEIITADGEDVGMLDVEHRPGEIYLRLGLTEIARHGDNNIKIAMRAVGRARSTPDRSSGPT